MYEGKVEVSIKIKGHKEVALCLDVVGSNEKSLKKQVLTWLQYEFRDNSGILEKEDEK